MATGIVKEFNDERGFGLLFPLGAPRDADLIFFHVSQLRDAKSVPIGAEVRFQKVRSDKGVQAANVELLEFGGQRTLTEARRAEEREKRKGNKTCPNL